MNKINDKLIFTDLDGTLLDLDTQGWEVARSSLDRLRASQIPIILCSSRTFAELRYFQIEMQLKGPIIYENGAGVALPQDQFKRPTQPEAEPAEGFWLCGIAKPYGDIINQLRSIKRQKHYQFSHFADMSIDQIMAQTSRNLDMAVAAKQRRHNEALIWLDSAKAFDGFVSDVQQQGLQVSRGSQHIHIGSPADKGQAARWLINFYSRMLGRKPNVIALGDSRNDIPLLKCADTLYIIRPSHTVPLDVHSADNQTLKISDGVGPLGWAECMENLLEPVESMA